MKYLQNAAIGILAAVYLAAGIAMTVGTLYLIVFLLDAKIVQ